MERKDKLILILFVGIIISFCFTMFQINEFMDILKTCDDDFKIIETCKCVPCSWKDAEKYNGKDGCLNHGK